MTKASDSPNKMTAREAAAVQLKVPNSGCAWLDEMIKEARDLDAEAFEAKLNESTHGSYEQAAGRVERLNLPEDCDFEPKTCPEAHLQQELSDTRNKQVKQGKATKSKPQGPKDPPAGGAGKKIG